MEDFRTEGQLWKLRYWWDLRTTLPPCYSNSEIEYVRNFGQVWMNISDVYSYLVWIRKNITDLLSQLVAASSF